MYQLELIVLFLLFFKKSLSYFLCLISGNHKCIVLYVRHSFVLSYRFSLEACARKSHWLCWFTGFLCAAIAFDRWSVHCKFLKQISFRYSYWDIVSFFSLILIWKRLFLTSCKECSCTKVQQCIHLEESRIELIQSLFPVWDLEAVETTSTLYHQPSFLS